MIDFRYHLTTIIAVFLSLAIGIVVGTTALNGPVQAGLNSTIDRLRGDNQALEGQVGTLRGQVQVSDRFAQRVAPQVVGAALADQQVLLVTDGGTPAGLTERVEPQLTSAGATVSGRLRVLPALYAPQNRQLVSDLVAKVAPAGLTLPAGEPVEQALAELAAALAVPPDGKPIAASAGEAVVAALVQADLVQFTAGGAGVQPATSVLVLTGGQPQRDERQAQTMLALASAFDDRSAGVVIAGTQGSERSGGLLRQLRDDSGVAGAVSGVDNVDRGSGLVAVVLALAEQLRGGTGQYGAGEGTSGPLPSPEPAAAAGTPPS